MAVSADDVVRGELKREACQRALWLALHAAQECDWPDVTDELFRLHALAVRRNHERVAAAPVAGESRCVRST